MKLVVNSSFFYFYILLITSFICSCRQSVSSLDLSSPEGLNTITFLLDNSHLTKQLYKIM